jgi:DNA gyrase subunit A
VTITRGGYAKRTRADQYRTQKRGGKGVRGATLRGDDVVEHFIATSNHHWILFFTTAGRVYRTKAYNLPEASRDAKGGHVAGLLSFQPDENIAQVLAIRDYEQAPYLVLATRNGLVKKTRLGDYNSPRQAGVIAINFREDDDELIGAELVFPEDEILLVSRKGQAVRFRADDSQLRPMGRATSGVSGMKYADGDSVLSMSVIRAAQAASEESEENIQYVFTMTDGGFAKRTRISEYRLTNRGTKGVRAMTLANEQRGVLVGAFIVEDGDEILSITQGGQVVRSPINEDFRPTGRPTMGVKFVTPKEGDAVAVVARSVEAKVEEELEDALEGALEEAGADTGAEALAEVAEREAEEGAVSGVDGQADPTSADPESENAEVDATIEEDDASE